MIDDEDDFLPELPGSALGDDEPPADDELGLEGDIDAGDDERVGLDDATGLDDDPSSYALELPPDDAISDEDGIDAIPLEEGIDQSAEYGWTDETRAEDGAEWDADLPGLSPLAGDDGGEEGVDEVVELAGDPDEAPHLAPLREEEDDAEEDAAFGDEAALATFEEGVPVLGPALEPPACRVETLVTGDIAAFTPGPPALAAGPAGIFVVAERAERIAADAGVLSIAAFEGGGIVAGTRSGALRSIDGGATFAAANLWANEGRDPAQPFFVVREALAPVVWGRDAAGALFRSDDVGATWAGPLLLKPVVALAAPEDGGIVALCAGRDASPQIARSDDGGQRWTACDGPPLASSRCTVAVMREWIAVASEGDDAGPFLSQDRGRTWARVPGVPAPAALALAWEPGGLALYAAHRAEGRVVVARYRPGGGEPAVVLDLAAPHLVHGITLARREGLTVLHVASSAGLFRIVVDPDHAP